MTHDEEPKFKHQTLWVALMWVALVVFAVWYWQHPEFWGIAIHRH